MSDEFEVEEIIGRRVNNGRVEYKIKWEGFPMSQSTWEPLRNLKNVIDMIDEYDMKRAKEDKKSSSKDKSRSPSPTSSNNPKKKTSKEKHSLLSSN